jgi:hypothetical protein
MTEIANAKVNKREKALKQGISLRPLTKWKKILKRTSVSHHKSLEISHALSNLLSIFLILSLCFYELGFIQLSYSSYSNGSWHAEKTHYPRLIYEAQDIPKLRSRIGLIGGKAQDEVYRMLYDHVKSLANSRLKLFNIPKSSISAEDKQIWVNETYNANIVKARAFMYAMEIDIRKINKYNVDEAWMALANLFYYTKLDLPDIPKDTFSLLKLVATLLFNKKGLSKKADEAKLAFEYVQWMASSLTAYLQAYDILKGAGYNGGNEALVKERLYKLSRNIYDILTWVEDLVAAYNKLAPKINDIAPYIPFIDIPSLPEPIYVDGNIFLKGAAAVGLAGITFNKESFAKDYVFFAATRIRKILDIDSYAAGSSRINYSGPLAYIEGPSYQLYAAETYLPFMRAFHLFLDGKGDTFTIDLPLGLKMNIVCPDFLSSSELSFIKKLHEWGIQIRLPDDKRPNFDDSHLMYSFLGGLLSDPSIFDKESAIIQAWDWRRTLESAKRSNNLAQAFSYTIDLSVDLIASYDSTLPIIDNPSALGWTTNQYNPVSGNVVFRSDWTKNAIYMLLLAEPSVNQISQEYEGFKYLPLSSGIHSFSFSGHEHPDPGSFIIYAYGEPLAIDSGYGNFEIHNRVNQPRNHNIVLIKDIESNKFLSIDTDLGASYINNYVESDSFSYAEVLCRYTGRRPFSRQDERIDGFDGYTRNVLFISREYFIIFDQPSTYGSNTEYHWILHGNAGGSIGGDFSWEYLADKFGVYGYAAFWSPKGVEGATMAAFITSTEGLPDRLEVWNAEHATNWIPSDDFLENHKAISVIKTSREPVRFLSIIYPAKSKRAIPKVSAGFGSGAELRIDRPNSIDIALAKKANSQKEIRYSLPNGEIQSDAYFLFASVDAHTGTLTSLFIKNATWVKYQGKTILASSDKSPFTLAYDSTSGYLKANIILEYSRRTRKDFHLDIYNIWEKAVVKGVGISSWNFNKDNKVIEIFPENNKKIVLTIFNPEKPKVQNNGFEKGFDGWGIYGDGSLYEVSSFQPYQGRFSAHIKRDVPTGNFFGIIQKNIPIEPDTEYKLTVMIKTNAVSGSAAVGLGIWSNEPEHNTHKDFGWTMGKTDWKIISGTWKSKSDETTLDICLYCSQDFVGEVYFDNIILEKIVNKKELQEK